jgi:hypothetical protein
MGRHRFPFSPVLLDYLWNRLPCARYRGERVGSVARVKARSKTSFASAARNDRCSAKIVGLRGPQLVVYRLSVFSATTRKSQHGLSGSFTYASARDGSQRFRERGPSKDTRRRTENLQAPVAYFPRRKSDRRISRCGTGSRIGYVVRHGVLDSSRQLVLSHFWLLASSLRSCTADIGHGPRARRLPPLVLPKHGRPRTPSPCAKLCPSSTQ